MPNVFDLMKPDKPGMPPGGSPATDTAYERWLFDVVDRANLDYGDRHYWRHHRLPESDPVRSWQVTNHLLKWALGMSWPDGSGPNNNHRIRLVSVQFSLRREAIEAEALRYIAELVAEAEAKSTKISTPNTRSR